MSAELRGWYELNNPIGGCQITFCLYRPLSGSALRYTPPPATAFIALYITPAGNATDAVNLSAGAPPGGYNISNLNSIQVTYGGVSKTSTLYTSEYNDNTNFAVQRWIESLAYASNWNNPGGAENFNDWIRSPYYYFDFSSDRSDSSSYVNVQFTFSSQQEANTNCFIAAFYTRLIRSEYANGQLTQLTAVNA